VARGTTIATVPAVDEEVTTYGVTADSRAADVSRNAYRPGCQPVVSTSKEVDQSVLTVRVSRGDITGGGCSTPRTDLHRATTCAGPPR